WIGLGGDASKVQSNCIFYKTKSDRNSSKPSFSEHNGRFFEMDWACDIDWFDEVFPWRGWIPTSLEDTVDRSWRYNLEDPTPMKERDGALLVETSYAMGLKRDFFIADELVTSVLRFYPLTDKDAPPFFDVSRIDDIYETTGSLQAFAAATKRAVLDRVGWLRWWTAAMPEVDATVPSSILERIRKLKGIDYPSRGYLIEVHRMWKQLNLALWVRHRVPVYYSWSAEERLDERFSKLNPKLIAADSGVDGDKVVIEDILIDDGWRRASASTWKYDPFLQRRDSIPITFHLSYESDSRIYIIDFQGWQRRALPENDDPAYYAERYFFLVRNEDHQGMSSVTFWRWRPRKEFIAGSSLRTGGSGPGECDNLENLREMYRMEYAPREDRQFDEESGLPISPLPPTSRVWYIPTSFYPPSPPADKQVQVPSPQGSRGSSVESPSLLSRLSEFPLPDHGNLQSGEGRSRERTSRPLVRDSRRFGSPAPKLLARISSRSRSPRRLIGPSPPNQPLRGTEYKSGLRASASIYTYLQPTFSVAHLDAWNGNLFLHGVLIVPDKRVEVRMRYFANCFPATKHICTVLTIAIEHRQAFQIGIRPSDFKFFPARTHAGSNSAMIAAQYSSDFIEPPLVYHSLASYIALYSGRMADLLARPHARAFIGMGGACSWVAQRWSGEALIEDFMSGPSAQTTVYFRGANDATYAKRSGVHWDRVSAQEIDLLFGCLPHVDSSQIRWLYPPPHVLEAHSDHWSGEWNATLESIFCFITEKIHLNPPETEPKTKAQWKKFLRTYNRGPLATSTRMTSEDADTILGTLRSARLHHTWNLAPINTLYIPE
ncbi:hypothetical protein M413DRAFT_53617, partial [Hebeloma cylindrosporum]